MEKICGIYKITNLINGKEYIGLSKDCHKRWSDHYSKSINPKKQDEIKKPLYMAMRKYGRENFSFVILEECAQEKLQEREIYWISYYNSYKFGYNATPGGDIPNDSDIRLGESHGMAKLTEAEVIKCRELYRQGERSKRVWEENFSNRISYSGFQRMWHGQTWKHIMPEVFEKEKINPRKKITDEIVIDMKNKFANGWSCAKIYHFYEKKYSRTTINDICNEKRYRELSAM